MIRATRREAGLTQAELAARSGTSQPTLSAYEHGRKAPSAQTLQRILAAGGARLTTRESRPVITPSAATLGQRDRALRQVIELAAELPTRHPSTLAYPRLPLASGSEG